jgi:hypothetical protein
MLISRPYHSKEIQGFLKLMKLLVKVPLGRKKKSSCCLFLYNWFVVVEVRMHNPFVNYNFEKDKGFRT